VINILDPLYGRICLPAFAGELIRTPELQRLSQIRLMNVCGSTMLAATTTTRLEHAIGVAHLAKVYSQTHKLGTLERNNLILGCLIHDVASFPYGHLVERIFTRSFPGSSDHCQRLLDGIFNGKEDFPIYRGCFCELYKKLGGLVTEFGREPLLAASLVLGPTAVENSQDVAYDDSLTHDAIARLHRLISGPMDLDNIDNVFRLAARFGLKCDGEVAEKLAGSFSVDASLIRMREEELWLVKEWQRLRSDVYDIFFTNTDILAMKALLTYCVEQCIGDQLLHVGDWVKTDSELLDLFLTVPSIRREARQILLSHELTCHGLFVCHVGSLEAVVSELSELRTEVASSVIIEDKNRRRTATALVLERDYGARRLYMTAEYDKGAAARQCTIEALHRDHHSSVISLGANSNRIIVSVQIPRWCRLKSPHVVDIVADSLARRLDCAAKDVMRVTECKRFANALRSSADINARLFD
jgi:hypothetical protein